MVASEKERLEMRLQLAQSSSKKKSKNKREPSSSGGSPRKSSSRRRAGKENKTDKVKDVAKVASKRKTTVQWSKEDQFHYTHTLLNIIEESPRYRQIYGFDKGTSQDVQTGGLTVQGVSREVAEKVFVNQPNSPFKPSDLTSLTKVVSNRVNALKKMFREWKQELGQTGHGLVEEDRLDEIVPGSKLANVWDALQKKFPWYQQIQRMMGRSPLVDRSALTNSLTPVNLDVLATSTGSQAIGSGNENGSDNMDADSQHSQPITESWSDSQKCEDSDSEDDSPSSSGSESDGDKSLAPTPVSYSKTKHASAHTTPTPTTTSSSSARPRKMNDLVYDIATQDRTQRLRITEVKAKEKTRRAEKKMKIKADVEMARLRVRQAELDHQAREAEKQRAHERDMLDRQMALAQLHAGGPPQLGFPALDPRLR